MRVDLGTDGAGEKRWAELTDLDDVPRRVMYRIQEDVLTLYDKGDLHPALMQTRTKDLLIANLVTNWSFGDPPNKDIERLLDLPNSVYQVLAEAVEPYQDELDFMKAGKAKAEPSDGPADTSD